MSKIIDIKTKKELKQFTSYVDRTRTCNKRASQTEDKKCDCVVCKDKEELSSKLATISQWLISDYSDKSGNQLYWADWFDVTVSAANKVQELVYPHMK